MLAHILCAGRTDVGKRRESNQDQFLIADLNKSMIVQETSLQLRAPSRMYGTSHGKLLMVADGMGGHMGGQRASTLAMDQLINQLLNSMHWFFQFDAESEDREQRFIEDLKRMMQHAHDEIEKESQQTKNKGMGTTLTMAYVIWPLMYVVHAGDSRCYLLRGDDLRQVTNDHTVSQQMVESGGLTASEANQSPWSNVLYNALGAGGATVETEIHKVLLKPGDLVLLCSDGLNRHVPDPDIKQLLQIELEPQETCRSLIDLANFRGGQDNTTVVVARMLEPTRDQPKIRVTTDVTLERLLDSDTDVPQEPAIRSRDTDEHREETLDHN
jgi:serine/threonine protein phosphatase PrpC